MTLALCHNVTPVETAGSDDWTLQAPSPDEAALVKYARECGIKLIRRDDDCIVSIFGQMTDFVPLAADIRMLEHHW